MCETEVMIVPTARQCCEDERGSRAGCGSWSTWAAAVVGRRRRQRRPGPQPVSDCPESWLFRVPSCLLLGCEPNTDRSPTGDFRVPKDWRRIPWATPHLPGSLEARLWQPALSMARAARAYNQQAWSPPISRGACIGASCQCPQACPIPFTLRPSETPRHKTQGLL